MKRKVVISILSLIAVSLFVSLFVGCSGHEASSRQELQLPTAEVQVETIESRRDMGKFQAVGRVKSERESTLASKVMGKVLTIHVAAGDKVKKDALLVTIDNSDARSRVVQAKGALAQAEAAKTIAKQMLDRFETLKQKDSASEAKYDKAQFDYRSALGAVEQARGALSTARAYLKETKVLAPFDGRVIDTLIEEGEMASPGYPLVRMEGDGELEFEATVTAQDISALAVGQAVTVNVEVGRGEKRDIPGVIHEIVPAMDRVTHSNTVRVRISETKDLRSGMFGRATFSRVMGSCPGVVIDEDRLVRNGQLSAVYVVDATDHIRLRLVREGRVNSGRVEIVSGLANGDRLVVSEISVLQDGQPAKVVAQ